MKKSELKHIIKEKILKEFSLYQFTDGDGYKDWKKQFFFVIDDLNSRKISKATAYTQINDLMRHFASDCMKWAESEIYNEREFIKNYTQK